MARWIAFVRAAAIGGMPGALIGAGTSASHGEAPLPLIAAGFLLGALMATRSRLLGALATSRSAVTAVSLTTYVVVFLGLQVAPASAAWLIALAVMAILGLGLWIAERDGQRSGGPVRDTAIDVSDRLRESGSSLAGVSTKPTPDRYEHTDPAK